MEDNTVKLEAAFAEYTDADAECAILFAKTDASSILVKKAEAAALEAARGHNINVLKAATETFAAATEQNHANIEKLKKAVARHTTAFNTYMLILNNVKISNKPEETNKDTDV